MKKTLFIVDDDAEDCVFFIEAVKEIDPSIKYQTANNGEDALRKLTKEIKPLPDYIFLDLNMPRMNGRECLVELKKNKDLKDIPVIIYTTSSASKDIDETRELGAAYFITKPCEFQKLCDEITFVLKNI